MALSGETVGHCGGDISVQKAGMLAISLFGRHFDSQVVHFTFNSQHNFRIFFLHPIESGEGQASALCPKIPIMGRDKIFCVMRFKN